MEVSGQEDKIEEFLHTCFLVLNCFSGSSLTKLMNTVDLDQVDRYVPSARHKACMVKCFGFD